MSGGDAGVRRLVGTRRRVAADRRDTYLEAWRRYAQAVEAVAGRAWAFRAATGEPVYMEFLEFRAGADPRQDDAVRAAGRALERIASPDSVEAWVEAGATDLPDRGSTGERA